MPPPRLIFRVEKSSLANSGLLASALNSVLRQGKHVELEGRQILDEAGDVARIRDQQVAGADARADHVADRQREDVIQRQGTDEIHLLVGSAGIDRRLQPLFHLQHVGHHVAVEQGRALRHAGGAARVLQEGDVLGLARHGLQRHAATLRQHIVEAEGARQRELGHHLLDLAHHQIHQHALEAAEQVAHGRDHHVLDRGVGDHLFQRGGEVLDDDDGLGAAVLELVLQFARRVQRIDVHHHVAGTQHRRHRHRVLHDVGHHDGNAAAGFDAARLQPGAELARGGVELAVGDRLAHADEGGARGILLHRLFEHRRDGFVAGGIDLGRHAGGVAFQPDFFHCGLLLWFCAAL
jgi:hypothetical protein